MLIHEPARLYSHLSIKYGPDSLHRAGKSQVAAKLHPTMPDSLPERN